MESFLPYAPLILAIIIFLVQFRIFVTPEQLEKAKAEIKKEAEENQKNLAKDIEEKYLTLAVFKEFKENVTDMKEKIDKMYDCLIGNNDCNIERRRDYRGQNQ